MIYLASPYSASPATNFKLTEVFVAGALRQGRPIFSPIVHCHQIALDYNLPGDFEFWKNYNLKMLNAASNMWVLTLPGWRESKGVAGEIEFATDTGIPIIYVQSDMYEFSIADTAVALRQEFDKHVWISTESLEMQSPNETLTETIDPLDITTTLAERGTRYGDFAGHARITQELKAVMRNTPNWNNLSPAQMESLEMVAHKIGRILNGDPNYFDSWHDIEGYARLVSETLEHE